MKLSHALIRALIVLSLLPACGACAFAQSETTALRAIDRLDVQRYLGRWYEIARYPNKFQSQCVSDASADYALQPDGRISVLNQCRMPNGEWSRARGVARQIGAADSARLKVRFAPEWLSLLPWVWGDYWIIDLDASYGLVAVSEPSRQYLWILSRTPQVPEASYASLLQRLATHGLDTQRLQRTSQALALN